MMEIACMNHAFQTMFYQRSDNSYIASTQNSGTMTWRRVLPSLLHLPKLRSWTDSPSAVFNTPQQAVEYVTAMYFSNLHTSWRCRQAQSLARSYISSSVPMPLCLRLKPTARLSTFVCDPTLFKLLQSSTTSTKYTDILVLQVVFDARQNLHLLSSLNPHISSLTLQ